MAQVKSDLRIHIYYKGKSFRLNCHELLDKSFVVRRGRLISEKLPRATATQIFKRGLSWVTKQRSHCT